MNKRSKVGVIVHEVRSDGLIFSRKFLSRGGNDEFSTIVLRVKTECGEGLTFDFYVDINHADPVTVQCGEDVLVIPGKTG